MRPPCSSPISRNGTQVERTALPGSGHPLVLASRSPQRRAILEQLGLKAEVLPVDVEELAEGDPREIAARNARRKAHAAAARVGGERLVVACDTLVALDDRIYGKPADKAGAGATLTALSGRVHEVVSGLCALQAGVERAEVAITRVRFRTLDARLLRWYLATGEWRERAGGYAVQGRGAALVAGIEGDYLNVVGLPLATMMDLLPELLDRLPDSG